LEVSAQTLDKQYNFTVGNPSPNTRNLSLETVFPLSSINATSPKEMALESVLTFEVGTTQFSRVHYGWKQFLTIYFGKNLLLRSQPTV
jgi:hypothetical protein